jgi:hypothetical protein
VKRFLLAALILTSCSSKRHEEVAASRAKIIRTARPMNEIRGRNACVELTPGGKILVIASDNNGGSYSSTAELYDPTEGTWTPTSKMNAGRWDHSATLIGAKVLVAGGYEDDKTPPVISSAEIFDPATGTFTTTGSMTDPRKLFALVTPSDGKPLAIGGVGAMGGLFTVEQYDPSAGTWSTIAPLIGLHAPSNAVVLSDGKRVLVTGFDDIPEIFDGTSWKRTSPQMNVCDGSTLTLLSDGRVLSICGTDTTTGAASVKAEVYNPSKDEWTATGPMAHARAGHSAVAIESGLVIVAGGSSSSDVEAFDPKTNKFYVVGYLSAPREFMCATTRGTGAIFMGGTTYAGFYAYVPNVDLWEPSPTAAPCAVDAECASGKCVSNACDGGSDALPPSDGGFDAQPATSPPVTPGAFQRCTKDADCSTGHCSEGVCCDTACKETCKSCALPSAPGKCTAEPIGVDLKGECGAALSCTGTCGPEQKCIGAGPGAQCAKSHCTSANAGVGPATCISQGAACPTEQAVPFDCGAYACEPAFGACLSSCSSSTDCAGGYLCDTGSKTCMAPAPAEDSGGCTYGRATTGALPIALLLGLSALGRRRTLSPSKGRSRAR